MKSNKLGNKLVLANQTPYGPFGHNNKIPKFIEIEITEIKEKVPGEFSGEIKENRYGYIAKGSDGYIYAKDYPRMGEGMGESCWHRYCPDEEYIKLSEKEKNKLIDDYLWVDVVHYQCPAPPKFINDYPYIKFCDKHQKLYYKDCFYCENIPDFTRQVQMNLNEHKWIGWY